MLIGLATSALGGLPFGLVNLSVMNASLEETNKEAIRIAYGAAAVEVGFGLIAILAGGVFYEHLVGNDRISYIAAAVLIAGGLFFFLKTKVPIEYREMEVTGFMKGVLLNLVSIQVFGFWILAVAFLSSHEWLPITRVEVSIFLLGVWLGKIVVLKGYMILSSSLLSKSNRISGNVNRIIGVILFAMAFIQFLKP